MTATTAVREPVHSAPVRGWSRSGPVVLVVLVALLATARWFVAEPLHVVTGSMAPTVHTGSHVLVWKLSGGPQRGDVVALDVEDGPPYVKRVVAVGGDEVAIVDGRLVVNGRTVREPYADPRLIDSVYFGPVTVPRKKVFVLGDNRRRSRDSRVFGAVPVRKVEGRVVAVVWPLRSMRG